MLHRRASGILLHISSLPSQFGIGDFGPAAYRFADFLQASRQGYWQILPLTPTDSGSGNSPYSSLSAFAGNPLFISPELLVNEGLITHNDLKNLPQPTERVDYDAVTNFKAPLFDKAFKCFKKHHKKYECDFTAFCRNNAVWLDSWALYRALKIDFGGKSWRDWPEEWRFFKSDLLVNLPDAAKEVIEKEKFLQFIVFKQWHALKTYCNERGIQIVGDVPIFVNYDSADVWAHSEIFDLDKDLNPKTVSGVPPDYFSVDGQLWGSPLYNWENLKKANFSWWVERLRQNFRTFDLVRVDHFRGFVQCWAVPAGEPTAKNGKWVDVPYADLFKTFYTYFPELNIIAEDLGEITPDVRELIARYNFPVMRVLQFGLGPDIGTSTHAPHNYPENAVCYTGTHDNNTTRGWYEALSDDDHRRIAQYIGHEISADNLHWELLQIIFKTTSRVAMPQMQDILGLSSDARMNIPGQAGGNWGWRLKEELLTGETAEKLRILTEVNGRF
ncbi:MAG: 4-alpha-glucanotransferase [Bacteroidota bacterium]